MARIEFALLAALSLSAASPALAEGAALDPALRTMLSDAIASGSADEIAAVAKFVKRTAPAASADVDAALAEHAARIARLEADKAAALRAHNAGFFNGWKGEGQAGAYLTTGNSDTSGIALGLALTKEGDRWRHNLRAMTDYQRSNGQTTRSQWLASYEPNYKFNARLYAYGLAQYERDRYQGYSQRLTASGGLGYRLIDDADMTLDLKAGPAWRRTRFVNGVTVSRLAGLAGARYRWAISPTLTFTEAADVLVDSTNKTLTSLSAIDAKLGGAFSARLSYQLNHETDPPAGVGKTDTISRLTLVYGF